MSVSITIHHAVKRFGNTVVIPDLSLHIHKGEFFTLLGPSGCGKTTLLRMIAGFNTIEGGDFYFDETRVNDLDPAKRNIGMVFQNYAIFPHMTVRGNIAFGLRNRKLPADQIAARTEEFLELARIKEFADRLPEKLSGGQQQRVALARALAPGPSVMLLDEPFSGLDIRLRDAVRDDTLAVLKEQGAATLLVTHDPEEAMRMGDRIAVMRAGRIVQEGPPDEVYRRPANRFVVNFFGEVNHLVGVVRSDGCVETPAGLVAAPRLKPGQRADVLLRPEAVRLDGGPGAAVAQVASARSLGPYALVDVRLAGGETLRCRVARSLMPAAGQRVALRLDPAQVFVFPAETDA